MAVVEAWETLKQAVETYTGLSPVSFFTVLALAAAIYYTVAGFFETQPTAPQAHAHEVVEREPLRPPVQLGEVTEEELRAYDGSDREKPLLMAIKSQIYDVSQSRMFYGPGGPYSLFAGKDASRALAKMTFEPKDLTGDLSGLGPFELEALQDWENKFMSKYVKVGTVMKTVPVTVTEGSDAGASNVSDASASNVSDASASNVTEAVAPAIATENKDSPADDVAADLDALSEHKAVKANEN